MSARTTDETMIRELVENWARAVRTKNLDGILANHSPEILMFDGPTAGAIKRNRSVQEDLGPILFLVA